MKWKCFWNVYFECITIIADTIPDGFESNFQEHIRQEEENIILTKVDDHENAQDTFHHHFVDSQQHSSASQQLRISLANKSSDQQLNTASKVANQHISLHKTKEQQLTMPADEVTNHQLTIADERVDKRLMIADETVEKQLMIADETVDDHLTSQDQV